MGELVIRPSFRAGACLALLGLLSTPLLGGSFRLSNPESPVYYRYAVIAGERAQIVEGGRVSGDLHSNGDVITASGVLIDGDASASGKFTGPGTVTGTKQEGAPSVSLPRLATASELAVMADRKLQGDQTFNNAVLDDVVFVDGRVKIQGSLGGVGTLLATGDVTVESSPAVPGPETRISIVSLGSIALARDRTFRGIIHAGQDAHVGRGARLDGVVLASRRASIEGDVRLTFVDFDGGPPVITLQSPAAGAFVSTATPQITLSFSDDLSGVDATTASFLLDGQDRTSEATVSATSLSFQPAQPLAEGPHEIAVRVSDHSGKQASAEFSFTIDTVAPVLGIASPGPIVDGDSTPAVVLEFSDATSGIDPATLEVKVDGVSIRSSCALAEGSALCEPPELSEGRHTIAAEVADRAGNRTTAESSFEIALDREPPVLRIVSPASGVIVGDATPEIALSYSDAGSEVDLATLSIVLDGQDLTSGCEVQPDKATCEAPPLATGLHTLKAAIADRKGFRAERERIFEVSLQLSLVIEAPVQGELTQASTVEVSGTVSPEADSVSVNGIEGILQNGVFVIADVPLHEGGNTLTAIARSEGGGIGTATVTVVRDTAAPRVVIAAPRAALVTTSPQIAVTGEYVDPLSSNADVAPPVVKVNGFVAKTELRTFFYDDLLLQPGENLIRVTVTDTAGNEGSAEVSVTLVPDAAQQVEKLLGDVQSGPVGQRLNDPLVVRLRDVIGNPLPGRRVLFAVTRGGGQLAAGGEEGSKLSVSTDEQGLARVDFFLGSRAGAGNHEVTVTSAGFPGEVNFCASATVSEPRRIVRAAGDDHTGAMVAAVSAPYPKPLLTQVFDDQGNPVPDVPVTYRVVSGGGSFAGAETPTEITEVTNGQGLASATFTLGPQPGNVINLIEAGFEGLAELPVTFAITGLVPGPEEETAIVGLVLDNQDDPVPGVTLAVDHTDLTAVSDAQGRFRIDGVPVGTVKLKVDGKTTSRPGTWPYLEFHFTTISGADNSLGMPIRLLPIDVAGGKLAGGPEEVVIPMKGVPGATLTVAPNSVTFPNGSKVGTVSFTQVHGDKVPMIAPMGSNFTVAFTVQPPGTRFDPPAAVTLPNIGLPPGAEVDLFSFDHDIGEFLSVGTATVTPDGSLLRSNAGTGIAKAGWGGAVPPPPPLAGGCKPGFCTRCEGGTPVSTCGPCNVCSGLGCSPKSIAVVNVAANLRIDEITVLKDQSVLFAAQAYGLCTDGYDYLWAFGDGGTDTERTPTHAFARTGTYKVTVYASCKECSSVTKSGTMKVKVVELKIEKPREEPKITEVPEKATIETDVFVIGADPDPTAQTEFTWGMNLDSNFAACPHGSVVAQTKYDSGDVKSFGAHVKHEMTEFRGGKLKLTARATLDDTPVEETLEDAGFVKGTNPQRSDVQTRLAAGYTVAEGEVLQKIACQETGQRQFNTTANGGISECPLFNTVNDGGAGIMQITPPRPEHLWNWQENVDQGRVLFNEKRSIARGYPGQVRADADYQALIAHYNQDLRVARGLPPLTIILPDFTPAQLLDDTIRAFNGVPAGGQFGLRWHEFRVPVDAMGYPVVSNVNEAAGSGTIEWERVPVAARPSVGDPDYVNHIHAETATCGG